MAEEHVVTGVRRIRKTMPAAHGQSVIRERWEVEYVMPDGQTGTTIIPAEAFASRVAEYWDKDEPPPTVSEVLDLILHEFYIPADDPAEEVLLAATRQGLRGPARAAKLSEPVTVFNATSSAHARRAHMERIDRAKEKVRVVSPAAVFDPLDAIREHAAIDPEQVAQYRGAVAQMREDHAAQREGRRPGLHDPLMLSRPPSRGPQTSLKEG